MSADAAKSIGCSESSVETVAMYLTLKSAMQSESQQPEKELQEVADNAAALGVVSEFAGLQIELVKAQEARAAHYKKYATKVTEKEVYWTPVAEKENQEKLVKVVWEKKTAISKAFDGAEIARSSVEVFCSVEFPAEFPTEDTPAEEILASWNGVNREIGDCLAVVEGDRKVALERYNANRPMDQTPPPKPLGDRPITADPLLSQLSFLQSDDIAVLLDLQKCVNFINPAPYENQNDHLLDLVTAQVSKLMGKPSVENLPWVRAQLNVAFDLTKEAWEAHAHESRWEGDAAAYVWQAKETYRLFNELYGEWLASSGVQDRRLKDCINGEGKLDLRKATLKLLFGNNAEYWEKHEL